MGQTVPLAPLLRGAGLRAAQRRLQSLPAHGMPCLQEICWQRSLSIVEFVVGYRSGQPGQTVNLLANAFVGSNPSPTTMTLVPVQ